MKPLAIDFRPRRAIPPVLVWAVALALLLLAGEQAALGWRVARRTAVAEAQRARLASELAAAIEAQRGADAMARQAPAYADDVQAFSRQAAFPRDGVMAAVESARVVGVRLTALDMSAAQGVARVDVEFTDHPALKRYIDALNAGEPRQRWFLVQAQLGNAGTPGTATLRSSWRR